MANKAQQTLEATKKPTLIQMKNYTENPHFPICPLNGDVSLAKNWSKEHQAQVRTVHNKVNFVHQSKLYSLSATEFCKSQLVLVYTAETDLEGNFPCFAIVLKTMTPVKPLQIEKGRSSFR